jgi:beta-1,2-mannosidase
LLRAIAMHPVHSNLAKFVLLASVSFLAAQDKAPLPFGPWRRISEVPIIAPAGSGWEAAGTFNPAAIVRGEKIGILYRAQDRQGTSRLGYAQSTDGIHFTRRSQPVLSPETEDEKGGGVEDPRLVQFGDTYYLTYTGYNKRTRSSAWRLRKT